MFFLSLLVCSLAVALLFLLRFNIYFSDVGNYLVIIFVAACWLYFVLSYFVDCSQKFICLIGIICNFAFQQGIFIPGY